MGQAETFCPASGIIVIMKVCFIVIAYNAERTIGACIESILNQKVDKTVIVVDNSSKDSTRDIVLKYPVKLVLEEVPNRGLARAKGLASCELDHFDYLCFVDSDVELPGGWTQHGIEELTANEDVVAVGGPGLVRTRAGLPEDMDVLQYGNLVGPKASRRVNSLPTMDIIYKAKALHGHTFKALWTGEDAEFNFQLRLEGWHFLWLESLQVTHHHPQSAGAALYKAFLYGAWLPIPYVMHPRLTNPSVLSRLLYLPVLVVFPIFFPRSEVIALLWIAWLLSPFLVYGTLAIKHKRAISHAYLFVLFHSLRQCAQMVGIYLGWLFQPGRLVVLMRAFTQASRSNS